MEPQHTSLRRYHGLYYSNKADLELIRINIPDNIIQKYSEPFVYDYPWIEGRQKSNYRWFTTDIWAEEVLEPYGWVRETAMQSFRMTKNYKKSRDEKKEVWEYRRDRIMLLQNWKDKSGHFNILWTRGIQFCFDFWSYLVGNPPLRHPSKYRCPWCQEGINGYNPDIKDGFDPGLNTILEQIPNVDIDKFKDKNAPILHHLIEYCKTNNSKSWNYFEDTYVRIPEVDPDLLDNNWVKNLFPDVDSSKILDHWQAIINDKHEKPPVFPPDEWEYLIKDQKPNKDDKPEFPDFK